jgi:hypothetical protein
VRERTSRLSCRRTFLRRAIRVPIATSLCPERSGATNGRKLSRFVERSTSM